MKENREPCKNKARYRMTWPGTDERMVCESHADQFGLIAKAMGIHLQILELGPADDRDCEQPKFEWRYENKGFGFE
jgi:hypothetical protein